MNKNMEFGELMINSENETAENKRDKQLAKCNNCGCNMIEMTNDGVFECLNCGTPYHK